MATNDLSNEPIELARSLDDLESEVIDAHRTSIFVLYAKIFRLLLTTQISSLALLSNEQRNGELEELVLPSNEEWRHRTYHSLVELQRQKDAETEDKK